MKLTEAKKRFILHWGEMGNAWGINRTVAQVHALLMISPEPPHAEAITETLGVARSNVSTSIRELLGWGIVRKVSVLGDRRTHYESLEDVWEMFRVVVRERKRRELDPTFTVVQECLDDAGRGEEHFKERMQALLTFWEHLDEFYDEVNEMPFKTMQRFFKAGRTLRRVFGGRRR